MPDTDRPASPARRRFLKRTGWIAAGLTIAAAGGYPLVSAAVPVLPTFADPEPDDGLAWIQMMPDGRVRFLCPRMEMGQGASLGLSQVVAEELNLTQDQIECVLPDTSQIDPVKMTVGSESLFAFFEPVARSAAQLREQLRLRGARLSGVAASELVGVSGGFLRGDGAKLTYADLVDGDPVIVDPADLVPIQLLSTSRRPKAIGQNWRHHDLRDIVTGRLHYSRDVAVPDMVFGAALQPPVIGARIAKVESRKARDMPFVIDVVTDRRSNFVGVVTDSPFRLSEALDALVVEWHSPNQPAQEDIDNLYDVSTRLEANDFDHVVAETGSVDTAVGTTVSHIQTRYDTSFLSHSPMEPRAAVVWVQPDRTEVWCGTQDAFFVRGRIARIVSMAPEQVVVHPHRMGGAFGGHIQCQASEQAALLSSSVGRPVRVEWDRETEIAGNAFQPAFSHHLDIGVRPDGQLSHWRHDYVTSPIMMGPMRELLGQSRLASGAINVVDRFVPDGGSTRGALAPYDVDDKRIRYASVRSVLPTSAWRGLGSAPNAFAIECAMDELAIAAGIDPLALRLQNLAETDARLKAVLRKAAEMAGWPRDPGTDRGLGIAAAVYKEQTPVAIVAEAHIDHQRGAIRIARIWCAHDCGRIVNPDQVRNLIEGNIVWGCGMALKERITIEDGRIAQQNFDLYEPLRHSETPEIHIELIEPPGAPPLGVGESALPPVAPAIANAIFAASGQRLRRLPISYADLSDQA